MGRREQVTGNTRSTFDRALKESARGFGKSARERERDSKGHSGGKVRGAAIRGTDEAHCPLRQRRPSLKGGQKCAVHLAATQTVCTALREAAKRPLKGFLGVVGKAQKTTHKCCWVFRGPKWLIYFTFTRKTSIVDKQLVS